MNEYVSEMSATEKFEYKQKSGYGRPEKLRLALEGEFAPKQVYSVPDSDFDLVDPKPDHNLDPLAMCVINRRMRILTRCV